MHTATDLSLLRVQEELDLLLDSYGFEKTEPVRPSGVEGYFEWVQSLVDASQAAAQRFKKRTNLFFKEILRIRKIRDDFAKLIRIDPHASLTRVRRYIAHLACMRIPLFNYGPELSGYRHRFR